MNTKPFNWQPSKRLLIITGHFGSGKTNIAVNLAKIFAASGRKTTLIDFDTVNPYFRAADNIKSLERSGVKAIVPEYANTNLDLPTLPPEIYSVFKDEDPGSLAIFDVGGDDLGATPLGMFNPQITGSGYEMLYVVSMYRPLTASAEDAARLLCDIEAASRLRVTAIVNNSNIGEATGRDSLIQSSEYIKQLCEITGLPLAFSATMLESGDFDGIEPLLQMADETKYLWKESAEADV
ncbi:MAG TPA: ParA family protein [Clostridiales bacterium]|jgi:hypothetical protein|nr:ParA family protein [Clostridiales bacterium]